MPPPTSRSTSNLDVDRFRRALAGVTRVAGSVGRVLTGLLAFDVVGIAAAGAATGIGAFVAALAPTAGIIAALDGGPWKSTTGWPWPPSSGISPAAEPCTTRALASRAHRGAGVSCRFYYSGETP
ncbi:hypothetical protein AB0M31_27560 [Streptomyces sp. NPDC051773]|uniref:hypothetical protein n=1 Tax=Streptomyces sp. NPDC051773 TaxID=3156682 RepID=UPI003428821C